MKVKGVLKIVLLVAAAVLIVWLPFILVVGDLDILSMDGLEKEN